MEELQYLHALERNFRSYQMNGVLLNKNINIKQLQMNPKMTYRNFSKTVWECVDEFIRITSLKKGFCEFFFDFIAKKFAGDSKLIKFFFADALSILTYNESEENKYLSIMFTKKGEPDQSVPAPSTSFGVCAAASSRKSTRRSITTPL